MGINGIGGGNDWLIKLFQTNKTGGAEGVDVAQLEAQLTEAEKALVNATYQRTYCKSR